MLADITAMGMSDCERKIAARNNELEWMHERGEFARLATGASTGRPWRLSVAGQERILSMLRDGVHVDVILSEFNSSARKNREPFITPSHVFALADRGMPFAKVAAVHKCLKCCAKIVTDFCIACRVRDSK